MWKGKQVSFAGFKSGDLNQHCVLESGCKNFYWLIDEARFTSIITIVFDPIIHMCIILNNKYV